MVGVREEEDIDGLTNLQWSRKFFGMAWTCCHSLGLITNLDMVQCFFMMVRASLEFYNDLLLKLYLGKSLPERTQPTLLVSPLRGLFGG